jgi:hypothetical protein
MTGLKNRLVMAFALIRVAIGSGTEFMRRTTSPRALRDS